MYTELTVSDELKYILRFIKMCSVILKMTVQEQSGVLGPIYPTTFVCNILWYGEYESNPTK
jgi:predicted ATP-dependent Lon-type protease